MNILIAGGTSSVGKALKGVLENQHSVKTAGRLNCDFVLDVTRPTPEIYFPEELDVVIDTVADFGGNAIESIRQTFEINILGALKIAEKSLSSGAQHLIYISSMFSVLDASAPFFSVYSLSKKHAEDALRLFCTTHQLPLTIIRPARLYGNGLSFERHQPALYRLLEQASKSEPIVLNGSHNPKRNFLHINDFVEVIKRVLEQRIYGTYFCVNPLPVSFSEIVETSFRVFNTSGTISFDPAKSAMADDPEITDFTLFERISFFPKTSLEHGIVQLKQFREGSA